MAARVLFFKDIDKEDIPKVGGKGANLGEMVNAGFPVPNGFAVTVTSYSEFLLENNLASQITNILKVTNVENPEELAAAAKKIQKAIVRGRVPDRVVSETVKAYKALSGFLRNSLVAVRSSATAEDLPTASFAGQQATFLNIRGEANLINAIRNCWASLFTPRAIFYRVQNKIPHEKVKIAVIVQKMVQSQASGVIFSIDPVTNAKDRIVIEAVWGLGEMIVQGSVVPDRYVVQKETFAILSKEISDQPIQLTKVGAETQERQVPEKIRQLQKISNQEIVKLAKLADKLQKHYFFPQDIEWAKEGKNLYIVQTRPVTTLKTDKKKEKGIDAVKVAETPILTGTAASPGIGTGPAKVLESAKEIAKVERGDVLVAPMTSPDFVPAMRKAQAIITDAGGATSHAAIVSRELGIPCVVGTNEATKKIKDGTIVTVDGTKGQVFLGSKTLTRLEAVKEEKEVRSKTATKLYVNLGEPERAKEVAEMFVDGVGLLRAEFMIAEIGIHPKEAIKRKEQAKFVDKLASDLEVFCKAFGKRPVVYRATDFKTNEYRELPGGKYWEPEEPNPMLGFRGALRYIVSPEVFTLELLAIKKVRAKYKNLWLMIPFVRSPQELVKVRRLVAAEGLFASPTFKFWMMVELPVNVISLEDFIKVGIDGVSVGSNDLTMLIEGTDRDNAEVAPVFDERSPAVYWALKRVIKTCAKYNVTSSICGQAPSTYDDLVADLVKMGITSISVNPDAVSRVRSVIIKAEEEFINK
ncbi:MAG: phosphoenolpyruvate synthase [Patescibacteria group bacterium]